MKNGKLRALLIAFFAAILLLIAAVFAVTPRSDQPKFSSLQPHVRITATPGPEQQELVEAQTPVPTPVNVKRTPTPVLPENAVNLLSDGEVLFALDSRETAELLVRTYYQQCAYEGIEENCILLKATLLSTVATLPADGTAEYVSFEEALNKLNKNRSLISVQRTVEHAQILTTEPEIYTERTALLARGTRLFRHYGSKGRTLILSEIIYKDGLASSDLETQRRQVSTVTPRSVLVGTFFSALPEPGVREGSMGKAAKGLSFVPPINAVPASYFGTRNGVMHYGVDYSAAVGVPIAAPEDGTIIFSGERPGYGYVVEIRHENGFISRLSPCRNVTAELYQHVSRGDTVAYVPASEQGQTPTLHYELLIDGIPYNPMFYLP